MFTVNVNVITVRVVLLLTGMFDWFLTGIDMKTACLHASLGGQEEVFVRPPPLLSRLGFTEKGSLWRLKQALYETLGCHERPNSDCFGHVS